MEYMADYTFDIVLTPAEEGGFVVDCPALPGCTTQGESYDEAIANIREAIELVVEDMRELGEPISQRARFEKIDIAV
ncbi:MAG: type II toxin-antitoxin system HicB family antitoxin [Thermoleophilia bacterium]|nr:type II toxin-antitoxin system HicB family antitoxin [Thermoleophilia bacterium]